MKISTIHDNAFGSVVQPLPDAAGVEVADPRGHRFVIRYSEATKSFSVQGNTSSFDIVRAGSGFLLTFK